MTATSASGRAAGVRCSSNTSRLAARQGLRHASRRSFLSGASAPVRTVSANNVAIARGAAMDIRCEKVRLPPSLPLNLRRCFALPRHRSGLGLWTCCGHLRSCQSAQSHRLAP